MSTCSDYFAEIFDCIDKTPCKNPVVVLKDIKKSDLDALLDYMYLGEVDVRQSELSGLIKAAECLRIKGLAVPDEDPSKSARKDPPRVPERREDSPPAKRKRRDSGQARPQSPRPSPASSVPSHPKSVPDVPLAANHQENRIPQVRDAPRPVQRPPADPLRSQPPEASPTPDADPSVQAIKVEEEENSHQSSEPELSNDYDYGGSQQPAPPDIEKQEEADGMDHFAGDQAGPSGLQGVSMLGWGDEGGEGGAFPHNLFSTDDAAAQQAPRRAANPCATAHAAAAAALAANHAIAAVD